MSGEGTTVLVTGAAGFVGSHLVERCVELGYRVRALVRYNSRNSWGWLEHCPCSGELDVRTGDVRDLNSFLGAVEGVDTVFHLAALIGIPYSYVAPLSYLRTNVEGTYNVLQAARVHGVPNVVVASTSEVYGTAEYVPIDERHPLSAQSPYAATKIAADQLALSFHRSFGLPVRIVRPFNIYGPRQSARAVIPTVISQILDGRCELRLGNLAPTRDLTFVRDTVEGFIAIAEGEGLAGQVTHIGGNTEISVGELVTAIAGLMGTQVTVASDGERQRPASSEVDRLVCDNGKLLAATSWRPRYDLQAGLRVTIDWFAANRHLYKASLYNV